MRRRVSSNPRSGFSLMEIILATAMLMGSVIVLARLAGMGRTQANRAELLSEAQLVCETTMTEIVLGIRPLDPVENLPLLPPVALRLQPQQRRRRAGIADELGQ